MSEKSLKRLAAEARLRHAQAELIAIDYEDVDLGVDLSPEEWAKGIALLADLDYLMSRLDREERT